MTGKRGGLAPVVALLLGTLVWSAGPEQDADEQTLKEAGLRTDDASLLTFFRQRSPDEKTIKDLIAKLGNDDFQVREQAGKDLVLLGPPAKPFLEAALSSGDPEVVRRSRECLDKIGSGPSVRVIGAAARLLAHRKPAGAAEVLLTYLPRISGQGAEEEVRTALKALAVRDGKPEPVLVTALTDDASLKRGAAGVALASSGQALPEVRKLLKDRDPSVRLRVGVTLAHRKEKEAIPVLIELLAELKPTEFTAAEDILYRLAEDKAPAISAGEDAATRRRYREAWAKWWQDNGDKVDLARLDEADRFQGYTMVVLLDAGRILEVDADNKKRWEINGLSFPLDAQFLPGERILVAEYEGGRVTERSRTGEVLWEKRVQEPLTAQRLLNGNTFIATRFQLLEVDRAGKQVFTYMPPNGDMIMRAEKRRNGEIGLITATRQFLRLDPKGKVLSSFPVNVQTSGGRIEWLPSGRILLPLKDDNKVVEYDAEGNVVWEAAAPEPVAAIRLPNGHTVITSFQSKSAIAVDQKGKRVWEYTADARLTRAWRR